MKRLGIATVAGFTKLVILVTLLFVIVLGGLVYTAYKPFWQFNHLEQNARKVITGTELQAWATRMIDDYPKIQTNSFLVSQWGTNYPQQLRRLAPTLGPSVGLQDDTNQPQYMQLTWGSGFLGAKGFCVGRSNLAMPASLGQGSMWQQGVYFYHR